MESSDFKMDKIPEQVPRRFYRSSTAFEVLQDKDLSGKVAIITGANAGIGFETARSLALFNCEVVFGCRNEKLALEAIQSIKDEKADAKCVFIKLDLATLRATKNFTDEVKRRYKHIDYLILNACLYPGSYTQNEDNVEISFQIAHLSHFYMTLELSNLLDNTSRVIVVASEGHRWSVLPSHNWDESTINPTYCGYWRYAAYNNHKLFNVLFARELAKRWKQRGISVFSLHPGHLVMTGLSRHSFLVKLVFAGFKPFAKTMEQAAATTVYCAVAPELEGVTGYYMRNCYFYDESSKGKSDHLASLLWEMSEQMVKRIVDSKKDL